MIPNRNPDLSLSVLELDTLQARLAACRPLWWFARALLVGVCEGQPRTPQPFFGGEGVHPSSLRSLQMDSSQLIQFLVTLTRGVASKKFGSMKIGNPFS